MVERHHYKVQVACSIHACSTMVILVGSNVKIKADCKAYRGMYNGLQGVVIQYNRILLVVYVRITAGPLVGSTKRFSLFDLEKV